MPSCKAHCGACGAHFASDKAFDRHRNGPPSKRRCSSPDRLSRLESLGDGGTCALTGKTVRGVTIWEEVPR